jgi:hypothetical protein
MANNQVETLLAALRAEREAVAAEVIELQQRLNGADVSLTKLNGAIASLELLLEPIEVSGRPRDGGRAQHPTLENLDNSQNPADVVADHIRVEVKGHAKRSTDLSDRLRPYVPAGGQRLRSKQMVFDLLNHLAIPVTRDELRTAFFDYYGRENMERFWQRPENALNTAIDRAIEENIIREVSRMDGEPRYSTGMRDLATGQATVYSEETG